MLPVPPNVAMVLLQEAYTGLVIVIDSSVLIAFFQGIKNPESSWLKLLIILCRSDVLGDHCPPRRQYLGSGACGLQSLTDRAGVALEGWKRQ